MTLDELLTTVRNSTNVDWHLINCAGAHSGPSYRSNCETPTRSHSSVAVYKHNVAVTLAYGMTANDNYETDWTKRLSEPKASSAFLDIFYNSALVYREVYVHVDGARGIVPAPTRNKVIKTAYDLIHLLSSIQGQAESFREYFIDSGIEIE